MSISFNWHPVCENLATSTSVVTSSKKWPQVVKSKCEEISPVLLSSTSYLFGVVGILVNMTRSNDHETEFLVKALDMRGPLL